MPVFFFAWALAWLVFWQRRKGEWRAAIPVAVLGCATIVWMFFSVGGKALAVMLMGIPALAYWYARRKLPIKTIVAVVLMFIFVIFPIYNTFRIVNREGGTVDRLNKTFMLAQRWDAKDYAQNSLWAFFKRIGVITSVAAIIRYTGRWVDYKYGETLVLAPISLFIPRIVWPDKPRIEIGRDFGERFGLISEFDEGTMIAATVVGELYWNFHVPGVIAGMFLLGAGYRWIYRRYGEGSRGEPVRTAIYIALVCVLITIEGNVAVILVSTIKTLMALAVLLWVLRRAQLIETVAPAQPDSAMAG